jgi:pimeloyl-ACP methyl ester carboxylesterase
MKRIPILGTIAAGSAALTYAWYRKDMRAARRRIRTDRMVIDSPLGPIELAESGAGPAVLVVHAAGGGFDQGLHVGRAFLGDGFRIVAPSRFGYLGTPLPSDASPEAQADAYVRVLDALHLETVPVLGVSAGAPSAMQLCLRHPDRCEALVLVVPLAYAPDHGDESATPPRGTSAGVQAMFASDFAFWAAMRVAHSAMVENVLGTPIDVYRRASPDMQRELDRTLKEILPVSERADGLWNDGLIAANLQRYALETIHLPTLVISVEDDGYRTYDGARYTAEQTHGEFIGHRTGGHLLVGHEADVRKRIKAFLERRETTH